MTSCVEPCLLLSFSDGVNSTLFPSKGGHTGHRPLFSAPWLGRAQCSMLQTHRPPHSHPRGFPGPALSQRPPDFCTEERCSRSEAGLLHPHDRRLLWATDVVNTAVPCLRPGPVDSELTANWGSKVGHRYAGSAPELCLPKGGGAQSSAGLGLVRRENEVSRGWVSKSEHSTSGREHLSRHTGVTRRKGRTHTGPLVG